MTSADWQIARERGQATLTIRPFRPLAAAEHDDILAEGARLLDFTDPGAAHDVATPRRAERVGAESATALCRHYPLSLIDTQG